jgi:hypothetical protein
VLAVNSVEDLRVRESTKSVLGWFKVTGGGMKIRRYFCDVHPMFLLLEAPKSREVIPTLHCACPRCDRHYTEEYGYVSGPIGDNMDLGDMGKKLRCWINHEARFLAVTRVGGVRVWACPVPECETTVPFDPKRLDAGA